MPHVDEMFPSKYLRASDLQGREHTLIMEMVEYENIGEDDRKPVLYFQNAKKGFVLNKTNAKKIAMIHGGKSENWEGKEIVLFPTEVDFRGDMVEAIRVRAPRAAPQAPAAPKSYDEVNPPPPRDQAMPDNAFDDEIPF